MTIIHAYRTVDKSDWPRGEWDREPDKLQGVDDATGLDTLVVRGPSGALCGYVGVPASHPWFGIGYTACTAFPACEEVYCDHTPDVRVHGGLTFADLCHEPSVESWEQWRANVRARADEAVKWPAGDMGRLLRSHGPFLDDYEGWHAHRVASGICHVPSEGRPDKVWWFGFDCAHSGDVSPRLDVYGVYGYYRDIDYVTHEIASLAKQLAAVLPHSQES